MKKTIILFFIMCLSVTAFAQVTTSNIKGLVLDENSEPLPGANVVAIHTPTGTKYGAATNFDGRYNLLNLRVGGPYTITISYIGYKEQVFNDVFLTLGKTENIDVSLVEDSQQLDTVVITGSGGTGTFGSDRTGAETSVGRRELTRLPTINRSAADFTRLEPTASNGSFGGRNDQFNNFSLDGAIFNNPFGLDAATPGGQTDAQPVSLDAIDQIQVSTAPYDVTQSGFTGAAVNAVTKSGTNDFHGTVYGFYRNQDFTGSKVKGEDIFVPKLNQSQLGASIGGPIVKNKLFFFANLEIQRDEEPKPFDFSTYQGLADAAKLSQLTNYLNSEYGYDPGGYENNATTRTTDRFLFKLDWNIDPKNSLSARYSYVKGVEEDVLRPSNTSLPFANAGVFFPSTTNSATVELKSTLSDNLFNKLVVGVTTVRDDRDILGDVFPRVQAQDGNATVIFGTDNFSYSNIVFQDVYTITDNLSISAGKHTFTVGTHN